MTYEQFEEIEQLKKAIDSSELMLDKLKLIESCLEIEIEISGSESPFMCGTNHKFDLNDEDSKMYLKLIIQHKENSLKSLKEIFENIQIKTNVNIQ